MVAIWWDSWCSPLTRLLISVPPVFLWDTNNSATHDQAGAVHPGQERLLGYLVGYFAGQQPDPSQALESQRYLPEVWYRTIVGVGDCQISRFHEPWLYPCSEGLDYHSGSTGEPDRARRRTWQPLGHATIILKSRKEKMIESGKEEKKRSVQG